jgi:hypothetical protein
MLIDTLNLPGDLRKISYKELLDVCEETRNFLINTLADTGGHLASGLGTVELTVGLHAVYNTPVDKIIWDVGHLMAGCSSPQALRDFRASAALHPMQRLQREQTPSRGVSGGSGFSGFRMTGYLR